MDPIRQHTDLPPALVVVIGVLAAFGAIVLIQWFLSWLLGWVTLLVFLVVLVGVGYAVVSAKRDRN